AAAFAAAAVVALVIFVQRGPDHGAGQTEHDQVAGTTRGVHIEPGQLDVRYALRVHAAGGDAIRELHDGDTVATGERMRISVTTTVDATLYLGFCSSQKLQIYPSPQGLRTRAGEPAAVPADGGELVFDNRTGSEALYLIVSRDELATANPALAQ